MFKKIISNIAFSPSLIGQLNEYSKNIKREQSIRRLSLVFAILAISIQMFALIQPPESANAKKEYTQNISSDELNKTIASTNASQGFIKSESSIAMPGDQISYTMTAENINNIDIPLVFSISIEDILEYSNLIDLGGGTYDNLTSTIYWPKTVVEKNSKQTRTFVVRLMEKIPTTSTSTLNKSSYDCTISSNFGNNLNINVDCPVVKTIEKIVSQLPKIDQMQSISFALILIILSTYYYLRTKQIDKEVQIIRKDITTGTI